MSSNIIFSDIPVNCPLLSGFEAATVEYPPDRLNGKCTIHYGGMYSDMCLQVNLRDGKKEGEGLILRKNGTPYMSLQFIHDSIEGEVKRFDEFNSVILKGNVKDGKETGVFTEYDKEGKIIWMGYYMDGYQYITMTKFTKMPGYYEEKSRAGDLMGVSHYDETKLIRDGLSYEYKNGKVHRVCMYSNGSFVRVVMEMSGPTLTEYDDNGKKKYEGGFAGSAEKGFTREGKGTEFACDGETAVYVGDWQKGRRNGFGVEYQDHQAVFRGYWKNGRKKGMKEQKLLVPAKQSQFHCPSCGCWPLIIIGVLLVILLVMVIIVRKSTAEVTVSSCDQLESISGKQNWFRKVALDSGLDCASFDLSLFASLQTLEVGENSLKRIRRFQLQGMKKLETLDVGKRSFTYAKNYDAVEATIRSDGVFRLNNCPKLKTVKLGDFAFADYHSFEMTNLPSLQKIQFGESNFHWGSLTLASLIGWCV